MLADTAGTPRAVSVGKVMRVPPPATAFTAPAATAAPPAINHSTAGVTAQPGADEPGADQPAKASIIARTSPSG